MRSCLLTTFLFVIMFHVYAHFWSWSFEPGVTTGQYVLYLLGRVGAMLIAYYLISTHSKVCPKEKE